MKTLRAVNRHRASIVAPNAAALAAGLLFALAALHAGSPAAGHESSPLQASATWTPFATSTVTPSAPPTYTPTPTSTTTPSPTLTPISGPGSATDLPAPTAQQIPAAAPRFGFEVQSLVGGHRERPIAAMDETRAVVYSEGRLWVFSLEDPELGITTAIATDLMAKDIKVLHLMADTLVAIEEDGVNFVDLSQPERPIARSRIELDFPPRHIASAGNRLYLGSRGVVGLGNWWAAFDVTAAGEAQLLHTELLEVEMLLWLYAAEDHLVMLTLPPAEQGEGAQWQLYEAKDPTQLRPIGEPEHERRVLDMAGSQILIGDDSGVHLYELAGWPDPVEVGRWPHVEEDIEWGQIVGSELQIGQVLWDEEDDEVGTRLLRLQSDPAGKFAPVDQTEVPETDYFWWGDGHTGPWHWYASGSYCHTHRLGMDCMDRSFRSRRIELVALPPDGEWRPRLDCTSFAAFGSEWLASCGDEISTLQVESRGELRYQKPIIFEEARWLRFVPYGDRMLAHASSGGLFELLREGDGHRIVDTGLRVEHLLSSQDRIVGLDLGWPTNTVSDTLTVIDPTDFQILARLSIDTINRALFAPVLAGQTLFLPRPDATWMRYDLSSPGAPQRLADSIPFAPYGFVTDGATAYSLDGTGHLQVHALDGPQPLLVDTVDLRGDVPVRETEWMGAMFIAGQTLAIDRGAGWVSRLSLQDPWQPDFLEPIPLAGQQPTFHRIGDQLGIYVDNKVLEVFDSTPGTSPRPRFQWSRWDLERVSMVPLEDYIARWGNSICIALGDANFRSRESCWHYDVLDPERPRRRGRLMITDLSQATAEGNILYAIARQGEELKILDLADDRPAAVLGRWCSPSGFCSRVTEDRDRENERESDIVQIAQVDGYVYVLLRSGQLLVIDARDPATMHRVDEWSFGPSAIRWIGTVGELLVVGRNRADPLLVDVAEPLTPRVIGPIGGLAEFSRLAGAVGTMAVFRDHMTLQFVELAIPQAPVFRAQIVLPDRIWQIAIGQEQVVVGMDERNFLLVSVLPEPRVLGWIPLLADNLMTTVGDSTFYQRIHVDRRPRVAVLKRELPEEFEHHGYLPLIVQGR